MEGVEFFSGFLFPFINFSIFLAIVCYASRKPLQKFALSQRQAFLDRAREANERAAELQELEDKLQNDTARIEQDLSTIEQRAHQDADREAQAVVAEAVQIATQIGSDAKMIADAYTQHIRLQLQREILAKVQIHLQTTLLPNHPEHGDNYADTRLTIMRGNK